MFLKIQIFAFCSRVLTFFLEFPFKKKIEVYPAGPAPPKQLN